MTTLCRTLAGLWGVLVLVCLFLPSYALAVPLSEQQTTLLVRPDFINDLPGADPSATVVGASIFGGHCGPYALPGQAEPAQVPTDGAQNLSSSSFGQPCASYVAYEAVQQTVVDRARDLLFLQDSGGGIGQLVDWNLTLTGAEASEAAKSPGGPLGSMAVSPLVHRVENEAGTVTCAIDVTSSEPGVITVVWEASVTGGSDWLSLSSTGGTADATISLSYGDNTGPPRVAVVAITAYTEEIVNGLPMRGPVSGSPATVLVVQGTAENILSILPQSVVVPYSGGNVTVQVTNTGDGAMSWSAAVSMGEDFLSLQGATGTNNGAFTVDVLSHLGPARSGIVLVNAAGAAGSPATLTILQEGIATYEPSQYEVPKAIPNPGTVTSAIAVDDNFSVNEVQVQVHIEHTWDEDLEVSLRSPGGREAVLFSGLGGSGDNFGDATTPLTLDDNAATSILAGAPPFAGTFRAHDPLAVFKGDGALGVWTLVVTDRFKQDPSVEPPAFRFIDQIYGNNQGTLANQLENRLLNDTQIDQLLDDLYGADELQRAYEAEVLVRDALRYAPFDTRLRNVLLDIFYYRCVANTLFAKEKLVRAYKKQIDPPPPGQRVIDQEIAYFSDALNAYRTAANPYFELFTDGMGIRVSDWDSAYPGNPPFGYYLFVKEVPGRSLYAATFRDENDNPQSVLGGKSEPPVLLTGYKDWALLFEILRDEADTARELALRYVTRANEGDLDTARTLINEVMARMDLEGAVLLGIFQGVEPADLGPNTGVPEAVASWHSAVNNLEAVREFMDGKLNLLGFRDDFLMLVQSFEGIKDSFDALAYWDDATDPTTPLGAAAAKLQEARAAYDTYRGSQTDLAAQLTDQTNIYRDRLAVITGVDPGIDPENPPHPSYLTPDQNEGSAINLQVRSITLAQNRILRNTQQIANLKEQVEIEVQRRAQESGINANIESIRVSYGDRQAALTEEIAEIEGLQVQADNLADAANCITANIGTNFSVSVSGGAVAYTINAFLQEQWEEDKGEKKAAKEKLSAMEYAEITAQDDALLDANSKANIKTWLLGMKTLQLESEEAKLLLNQEVARLSGLLAEKKVLEARLKEVNANLLSRYYADPIHRLRYQSAMLDAQKAFEEAQKWVYFTVRAFEYKHNIPGFVTTDGYSLNSVFAARNADELVDIVTAVKAYDVALGLPGGVAKEDWLSFTEDILGYRRQDAQGHSILYTDPFTGRPQVTSTDIFRNCILSHMDDSGVVTLSFSTVLDNGLSFFYGPRYLSNGTLVTPGAFLDKINHMKINLVGNHSVPYTALAAAITQGGVQCVRDIDVGTFDPATPNHVEGEMTSWVTRFWFMHPGNPSADPPILPGWRFNEGLTANVLLNLTHTSHDTTTGNTFDEFAERSVAATDWKLVIFTKVSGEARMNINELDDLQFYFNHRAKNRPFKKSSENGL